MPCILYASAALGLYSGDKIALIHQRPNSVLLQFTITYYSEKYFSAHTMRDNNIPIPFETRRNDDVCRKIHGYRPEKIVWVSNYEADPLPPYIHAHTHTHVCMRIKYMYHVRRNHYVTGLDFQCTSVYDVFPFTISNVTTTTNTTIDNTIMILPPLKRVLESIMFFTLKNYMNSRFKFFFSTLFLLLSLFFSHFLLTDNHKQK